MVIALLWKAGKSVGPEGPNSPKFALAVKPFFSSRLVRLGLSRLGPLGINYLEGPLSGWSRGKSLNNNSPKVEITLNATSTKTKRTQ